MGRCDLDSKGNRCVRSLVLELRCWDRLVTLRSYAECVGHVCVEAVYMLLWY